MTLLWEILAIYMLGFLSALTLLAILQAAKSTPLPYAGAEDHAEQERAVLIKHARTWKREDVLNVRNN